MKKLFGIILLSMMLAGCQGFNYAAFNQGMSGAAQTFNGLANHQEQEYPQYVTSNATPTMMKTTITSPADRTIFMVPRSY